MNYQKLYNQLIENRKSNPIQKGYTETHHIIPICVGGSDNPTNLVKLTAREHAIAHILLTKIHPTNNELRIAALLMGTRKGIKVNSKIYEKLKRLHSDFMRNVNPMFNPETVQKHLENKLTPEFSQRQSECMNKVNREYWSIEENKTRRSKAISERMKGNTWNKGKVATAETKQKMSNSRKGKTPTAETKQKMSNSRKGKTPWNKGKSMSQEQKEKISAKAKNRTAWNKGLENPTAKGNGKKGAAKLSAKATGRKKVTRNDKITWSYPGDFDYPTNSVAKLVEPTPKTKA